MVREQIFGDLKITGRADTPMIGDNEALCFYHCLTSKGGFFCPSNWENVVVANHRIILSIVSAKRIEKLIPIAHLRRRAPDVSIRNFKSGEKIRKLFIGDRESGFRAAKNVKVLAGAGNPLMLMMGYHPRRFAYHYCIFEILKGSVYLVVHYIKEKDRVMLY